jgi:hypothetical protein
MYNYTAVSTMPILIFEFSTGSTGYVYVDDVSVVDVSTPSIQLLDNPSFENSTTNLTGWDAWCANAANCGTGYPGQITNSTCHSGNCYIDHCRSNYDYLFQSFSTTIGHIYTISFWFQASGGGSMKIYAYVQS